MTSVEQQALLDVAARALLDGERRYNALEVCALAGCDHETADGLWRAMGFPNVPDDFGQPELSNTSLSQGSSISGYVGYVVPEDSVIDAVFVSAVVGGHVLLMPADLGLPNPGVGTAVTVADRDGATATAPIDCIASTLSNTGDHETPLLALFQRPPLAVAA